MEEKNDSTSASPAPVNLLTELSEEDVHLNILRCHTLKNRVHRKLIDWLYVLIVRDHVRKLGAPTPVQYVRENLRYEKTEAYQIVGVARAVPRLRRTLDAFEAGELSWCQVKRIASVVKREKDEAEWLAFAKTHKPGELKGEVQHAIETGRATPRKNRYGLPNIRHTLKFDLSREEYEMARKALQKMAAHLWEADCADGKHEGHEDGHECEGKVRSRTPDEVLVELAKKVLEADLPGFLSKGRNRSIYNLVYETCRECKRGHLLTDEDPVEVDRERIQEVAKVAEVVEVLPGELIPGEALSPEQVKEEIPEEVLVKVLALSNHACARCGRKIDLHAHHIIFRSRGGPNEAWNLCVVCARDHASVHAGDLEVCRDSKGTVHFKPRSERLTALLADEVKELAAIPQVTVVFAAKEEVKDVVETVLPAALPAPPPSPPPLPTIAPELKREALNVTRVLQQSFGYGGEEARGRTAKALTLLSNLGRRPSGDEILNTAVYGRPIVYGPHPDSADPDSGTGRKGSTSDGARKTESTDSGGPGSGSMNG